MRQRHPGGPGDVCRTVRPGQIPGQLPPHTFASCADGKDLCQNLPDICSWNIYPNWYGNGTATEEVERFLAYSHTHGGAGKPFIFSEFGGGAIPGYIDLRRNVKFSENRQAEILRECLDVILAHPKVCGAFIWQFCDVRVDEGWAIQRPRCINDKGIVDEFRVPKLTYPVVQSCFRRMR